MSGKEIRFRRLFPNDASRLFAVPMDHSLTMGPIEGLERPGPTLEALLRGGAQAVIVHKGMVPVIRPFLRPDTLLGVHLNASTNLSPTPGRKVRSGSVAEAVRRGADFISLQVNFGDPQEGEMLEETGETSEECHALGMPLLVMAYVRVPKRESDPSALAHACRAAAEMGADVVKTNFPGLEGFRQIVKGVPVPVLVGGGPKLESEEDFLAFVRLSQEAGARGICIGRNLFQSRDPETLARQVRKILQGVPGATTREA
jgi:DhnA family fructose-bisphosphate aldolase class Ia